MGKKNSFQFRPLRWFKYVTLKNRNKKLENRNKFKKKIEEARIHFGIILLFLFGVFLLQGPNEMSNQRFYGFLAITWGVLLAIHQVRGKKNIPKVEDNPA